MHIVAALLYQELLLMRPCDLPGGSSLHILLLTAPQGGVYTYMHNMRSQEDCLHTGAHAFV